MVAAGAGRKGTVMEGHRCGQSSVAVADEGAEREVRGLPALIRTAEAALL